MALSQQQLRRQHSLSILSKSSYEDIHKKWQSLNISPAYKCLKSPEIGMVMVKAKAGATDLSFNMGEMTLTRSVVQLDTKEIGFGYTAGRNRQKSELVAVIDACSQRDIVKQRIQKHLIQPLEKKLQSAQQQRQKKVDSTKVNFFTMVRGEG